MNVVNQLFIHQSKNILMLSHQAESGFSGLKRSEKTVIYLFMHLLIAYSSISAICTH